MHGKTGLTGAFGAVGTAGADGKPGLTGASGAVGTAGADGKPGLAGASGAVGTTGDDGKPGLTGAPGAMGTAGADGKTGLTGASGAVGTAIAVVVTSEFPPQRFIQNTNDPIDKELPSFPNMTVTSADIHISPYSATSSYRLSAKVCQYILDVTEFQYILHIGAFVHPRIRNDYQVSVTADNTSGGLYNIQCIPTQRNSKVISVLDSIYVSSFDPDKFSLTRIVKLSGIIGKGFVRLSRDRLAILVDGNFTVVEVDVDGAPI